MGSDSREAAGRRGAPYGVLDSGINSGVNSG